LWPQGSHRMTSRYNSQGHVIEQAHFGLDGKPVLSASGYHRVVNRLDDRNKVLEQVVFGTNDEPARHKDWGAFRVLARHDQQGSMTDALLLGPNGRPTNGKGKFARGRWTYGPSSKMEEVAYWRADPAGRLRLWKRLDGSWRDTLVANLADDGRPLEWPEGDHLKTFRYDSRGNVVDERHFDKDGKPVLMNKGYHRWCSASTARTTSSNSPSSAPGASRRSSWRQGTFVPCPVTIRRGTEQKS